MKVAFLEAGEFILLGSRSSPLFVASPCIERDNEVHIFHASRALGNAIYMRDGELLL